MKQGRTQGSWGFEGHKDPRGRVLVRSLWRLQRIAALPLFLSTWGLNLGELEARDLDLGLSVPLNFLHPTLKH